MPNNDMARAIQALNSIDNSLEALFKVLEASNKNFLDYAKMIKTDIESHAFKPIDPKALKPRFDLEMDVVVYDETSLWDGWRGKIVSMAIEAAKVRLENGTEIFCYATKMIPLDEKPIEDLEPSEKISIHQDGKEVQNLFVADDQGRMLPSEWRHNLKINNIRVMKPDTGMRKLSANENRPMKRSEFDMYNTELYATGVIMNEEDAEGTPDSRGRLKPYEWRHKFGMEQFDPAETGHEFDENRLMTEGDFRIYNARVFETGVTKTDAQGKKVPADQPLPEKWRGDF